MCMFYLKFPLISLREKSQRIQLMDGKNFLESIISINIQQ